jgi:phosphatidylserine decarboxylase
MLKKINIYIQYLVPQHLLSRFVAFFANCSWPWFKNRFITWYIAHYKVDMSLAEQPNINAYKTFNEFFIRKLKPACRPISANPNEIICPVDGTISQIGKVEGHQLIQAKGVKYNLAALLGDEKYAEVFKGGEFSTIYLSPKDYHRAHIPLDGKLVEMFYVPGNLFSVNSLTAQFVPNLYARNERMIAIFATEVGLMAVIMVGAIIVAGINTVWSGKVAPNKSKSIERWQYASENKYIFKKGDEIGHFELGSTVIVLFEPNKIVWNSQLKNNLSVQFGQTFGNFLEKN